MAERVNSSAAEAEDRELSAFSGKQKKIVGRTMRM